MPFKEVVWDIGNNRHRGYVAPRVRDKITLPWVMGSWECR